MLNNRVRMIPKNEFARIFILYTIYNFVFGGLQAYHVIERVHVGIQTSVLVDEVCRDHLVHLVVVALEIGARLKGFLLQLLYGLKW